MANTVLHLELSAGRSALNSPQVGERRWTGVGVRWRGYKTRSGATGSANSRESYHIYTPTSVRANIEYNRNSEMSRAPTPPSVAEEYSPSKDQAAPPNVHPKCMHTSGRHPPHASDSARSARTSSCDYRVKVVISEGAAVSRYINCKSL